MQIKYPDPSFDRHIQATLRPIYFILGTDEYLASLCMHSFKKAFKAAHPNCDEKRHHIDNKAGWEKLFQEADTFGLFHDAMIHEVKLSPKKIDAKTELKNYVANPNASNLILIRAPHLTAKSLSGIDAPVINITALNKGAELNWIINKLKQYKLQYQERNIPSLIQAYTEGNLQAALQVIERLRLYFNEEDQITEKDIRTHAIDARTYKLYQLTEACLVGKTRDAMALVKRALNDQTEPTYILWLLAEELRRLEQLKAGITYQTLKIFSFRIKAYEQALKRLSKSRIYQMIQECAALDMAIKTGAKAPISIQLEKLILKFSG